ncbi:Protein Transport Protein Sec24D [Manis pentadactyla]|nr:Protein Transport Protein Sec24D [Manis pentadactyla]
MCQREKNGEPDTRKTLGETQGGKRELGLRQGQSRGWGRGTRVPAEWPPPPRPSTGAQGPPPPLPIPPPVWTAAGGGAPAVLLTERIKFIDKITI